VDYIVVALTQSDLVDSLAIEKQTKTIKEHFEYFEHLSLRNIVPVSIYNGNSIESLKEILFSIPPKPKESNRLFRYYVDRSFSI